MAFNQTDILNVDVLNEVRQELSMQIADSNPMLAALTKRAIATSQSIFLPSEVSRDHNARAIADGATFTPDPAAKTNFAGVTLPWTTYVADWSINKRLVSQLAGQPGALGSMLLTQMQGAAQDLGNRIAADIYGTQTGNTLIGLQDWMATDNTLGGIDRSLAANAWWRGNVYDLSPDAGASAGTLSTTAFDLADETYFERTKMNFFGNALVAGVGFLPKRLQTIYKQLFTSIDFSSLATAHFVNQSNASGQFGQNQLGYNGVPFIPDANVTAAAGDAPDSSRIYLVKPSEVYLATLSDQVPEYVKALQQIGDQSATPEVDGIGVDVEILGNRGELIEGYVKTYVQLVIPRPGYAGVAMINAGTSLS